MLYPLYILCGVAILYSLMIALAATSVWLGRNQTLYDFWFYITNFSRYPMEIYDGPIGIAAAAGLHVLHSGAGRGERAGPVVGQADAAGVLVPGPVCRAGNRLPAWWPRAGCLSARWKPTAAPAAKGNEKVQGRYLVFGSHAKSFLHHTIHVLILPAGTFSPPPGLNY